MKDHLYAVYIVTNPKRTVLYTGVTNDLTRRLSEHLADVNGPKKTFAGRYFCYYLLYYEWYQYSQEAILREKEIKGWTRAKKESLINSFSPEWLFLNAPEEYPDKELPKWYVGDTYWQPRLEKNKGK